MKHKAILLVLLASCSPSAEEIRAKKAAEVQGVCKDFIDGFLRDPKSAEFEKLMPLLMFDGRGDTLSYMGSFRAINTFGGWEDIRYNLDVILEPYPPRVVGGSIGGHYLLSDKDRRMRSEFLADSLGKVIDNMPANSDKLFLSEWRLEALKESMNSADAPATSPFKTIPYLD